MLILDICIFILKDSCGWPPEIPAGHKKLSVLKLSVLGSGRKKLSILVIFNQNISFLAKNALSKF